MQNKSILFLILGFLLGSTPLLTGSFAEGEQLIPSWVKTTAKFWVEGGVSDSEFLNALQFLVKEGVLIVDDNNSINSDNYSIQTAEQITPNLFNIENGKLEAFIELERGDQFELYQNGEFGREKIYDESVYAHTLITLNLPIGEYQMEINNKKFDLIISENGTSHPFIKTMKDNKIRCLGAWISYDECLYHKSIKHKSIKDQSIQSSKVTCDISYPDVCIAPYPPDLDCGEISHKNFRVTGDDKHGFDRDDDGIGCEGK